MVKLIGLIILIFLFVQPTKGQELYGKFLDQEQGLLSNECYDINYDENGYLIVGTQYGPMKYDGEKFIPICTNLSMERRIMYDFEKDPQGNIYLFNSKNELFKLKNDQAIWIGAKNLTEISSADIHFTKLYFRPGGFYISTLFYYLKFSFKTKKLERYYNNVSYPFRFVYRSNELFPFKKYHHPKQIYLMNNKDAQIEFPEYKQVFKLKNQQTYESREDKLKIGKNTYFLMNMHLFKKSGNHINHLNFSHILFMESFHNRIWLCAQSGLFELDLEGKLIHHHFKGYQIGGVAPLKSGGIAISFNKKGIFVSSDVNNRIYYNLTASAASTINQHHLLGTEKGSIYAYKNHQLSKITQCDTLYSNERLPYYDRVYQISQYQNQILANTPTGISAFNNHFKEIKSMHSTCNASFGNLVYKEYFYFISRNSIRKRTWKNLNSLPFPYNEFFNTPIDTYRCHLRINDTLIVIGTNKGLLKYNLKTDRFLNFNPFKKELIISSILLIGKNKLLVFSRYEGIYILNGEKIIRKIQAPCISISKALIFNHQLVVQGNDGIYLKKLNDSSKVPWIKFFSGESENTFILEKDLFISYKKDLIIKKLADYKLSFKPKIRLNKFLLNNLEIDSFPPLIPPNKSISIDLDILEFDANKLDLYYKLKGQNTISQFVKGTNINFDALKSGDYQLQIYPVIDGEIRFNNSKKFRFTVEKTFWESTIFYILIAVILLSIIVSILLLMNLRRKKRSEERSKLESKLNEYKLLAVKAQVNPHFLSNGLAAIQALILKGDNDNAAHYLAKFSYLMRKILYYSETQFISVKQELQLIDAYLELELLRFRNRFEIRKEIDLSESQLNEFNFPSLLLQPIFENAIWHGLKFQENNPQLLISFKINQNQELVVLISDNGPGFNLSKQNEEHLSKGNKLISERIDALNKQFQKQVASMEVISSDSGTKVIFIFSPQLYQSNPI